MVIALAVIMDFFLGLGFAYVTGIPLWHGLYCALANAVTLGGDVSPVNSAGYVVNALECMTVVPLFAATLALFTSGLTGNSLDSAEERIKKHVERHAR